jgi:hypothetical protein
MTRTLLQGWKRHRNHPEQRVQERFRREVRFFSITFGGAVWAMEKYFRNRNHQLAQRIRAVREEIHGEFRLKARVLGAISGGFLRFRIWSEERRLRRGWTYEPPTFVERRNWGAVAQ